MSHRAPHRWGTYNVIVGLLFLNSFSFKIAIISPFSIKIASSSKSRVSTCSKIPKKNRGDAIAISAIVFPPENLNPSY
jgi:hypothetical protein